MAEPGGYLCGMVAKAGAGELHLELGATECYRYDQRSHAMSVKSSISLSDQQDAFARSLVEQGRYSSVSAVIQNGLDLLRQRTEAEEVETAALKSLLANRLHGDFESGSEMEARVSAMIDKKRRSTRVVG